MFRIAPYLPLVFLCAALANLRAQPAPADFRPGVKDALARGKKHIVIPPGIYRLAPPSSGGEFWNLSGLKDVEIIADGVTLVGTKLMRAISLYRCSNVTLQGLTVDYDPLPFTQGEVVAEATDGASIDVKLHQGYPRKAYSRLDVIDPKTRYRKKGMPFLWGTKAEMIGDDVVRVRLPGLAKTARVGDLVSLSTGQEAGAPHAISIEQCERMTLRHVTVHSAPGMGILEADGEGGSTFMGCRIVPGPPPAGATQARLLSTSWDAFQSKTIHQGPRVEDCEIADAGDDSWSVQSADYLILKSSGAEVVVASRDEFTDGVQKGDRLRVSVNGPEYRILARKTMKQTDAGLDEAVLEKLQQAQPWSLWKVSPRCLVLTLDRASELKAGQSVYSPDRMGNGFVFRHNRVHSAGRVLLKAGGLMEGNTLDTPHALVVCPELPAGAAAGVEELSIRDNTILRGGWFCPAPWSSQAGIISVTAADGATKLSSTPVYKNLRIERNTVKEGAGPDLVVAAAQGVIIRGNAFHSPHHEPPPATGASYGIAKDSVVWIANCEAVTLENNVIDDVGAYAGEQIHKIEKP